MFFRLLFFSLAGSGCFAAVSFNKDIRPIMSDTCFRCHGPDKKARMAGLRLDIREEALKKTRSGVTPIVPGNPEASAVIQRVFASNPAKIMPPRQAHKELTAAQKDTLRRWIAEGAKYEGHWAYEPIRRPAVPENGAKTPIDAFIQERLRAKDLSPSPEADKRTLIRRLTLDLTGLPPTQAEVLAFLRDNSPGAYDRVVDRLLASQQYAEKQTMLWLDAVRYADTAGFHGDTPYPTWPYRDYVLRAFRDNMPFDRFTIEQLAGDLLPEASIDQRVASAYNRILRTSAEGGLQPKEYLAKYAADRVRTTSGVWLGATMGCAECHDHKFDPILTKDFYSMKAFFADIKETGLVSARGPNAHGTKLALPNARQARRAAALDERIAEIRKRLDAKAASFHTPEWEKHLRARHAAGEFEWKFQRPLTAESRNGTKLSIYNDRVVDANFYLGGSLVSERYRGDGLVVASGPNPDNETFTVTFRPGAGAWTALAVEAVQDESLPAVRLSRGADRFMLTEVEVEVAGRKQPFVLASGDGFGQAAENHPMTAIDGNPATGWGQFQGEHNSPFLALRFAQKVTTSADTIVTVRLRHDSYLRRAVMGRFRIALSRASYSWPDNGQSNAKVKARKPGQGTLAASAERGVPASLLSALEVAPEARTEAHRKTIFDYIAWNEPSLQPLVIELAAAERDRGLLEAAIPEVVVSEATQPAETRILPRGDWMNDSGSIVEPAIPVFLGSLKTSGRATRLDLARWIVSSENPLTARVFVNRMWRQFFGAGLSKVLEDLGSQGEPPTHPELLDWLAAEFMRPSDPDLHTWNVRHIIREIVTSHTYRQSSLSNDRLDALDPDNRLLARQTRFRVEAETVRDIALYVSGLLAERFGGPSVYPYQPANYYSAMNFPKRDYSASRGDDLYRRSLYIHWQRTFLHPTLLSFDAPSREECTVNRVNSNTPLQALVLLNDPIFVEAARVFAQKTLLDGGATLEERVRWAFERALNRAPSAVELRVLTELYGRNRARFVRNPAAAREFLQIGDASVPERLDDRDVAAMAVVTRAILNLHELITRN